MKCCNSSEIIYGTKLLTLYLQANIRAKRREQFKAVQDKPPEEISESKFFDARLGYVAVPLLIHCPEKIDWDLILLGQPSS